MPFPNRALLSAPVARDLYAEHPDWSVAIIPALTNGILQGWDTLDEDHWAALADPQITIYPDLNSLPTVLKQRAIRVRCYSNVGATTFRWYRRPIDIVTGDFWKLAAGGVRNGAPVGGDRPLEWVPIHHWAGNPGDTLGNP